MRELEAHGGSIAGFVGDVRDTDAIAEVLAQAHERFGEIDVLISGADDGERWRWNMRIEANGQEALLEELQHRVLEYEIARYEAFLTEWNAAGRRGAFLVEDTSGLPDRNLHFVFSDQETLAPVRFDSFLRDCRVLERPAAELQQAVTEEKTRVAALIEEQHEDLLNNFDPKVVPLRNAGAS